MSDRFWLWMAAGPVAGGIHRARGYAVAGPPAGGPRGGTLGRWVSAWGWSCVQLPERADAPR